jgi:MFS family permease
VTHQSAGSESNRPESGDRLALAIRIVTAPRRYIRPWYLAYLLLGIVTSGILPVLLPLSLAALSHRLSTVAYVIGAYNFGLLTSPVWGILAEHTKAYRNLFLGSFLVTAIGILGMLLVRELPYWLVSAFALGAGAGGAATLATFFIVDFAPRAEWEARIGWLQCFNATGQVAGLMLAAAFSGGNTQIALWVCVAILLLAMAVGGVGLPPSKSAYQAGRAGQPHLHVNVRVLAIFPRLSVLSEVLQDAHHLILPGLRELPRVAGTPFARFLLSWFVLAFAVAAFFSYLPLMLSESYGIAPRATALVYAAISAVAIVLYVLAGRLADRYGAGRIYSSGLLLRMLGFGLLLAPFLTSVRSRSLCGAAGFSLIVIAWPLLSVAGTDLGARLTPLSEGAAVGLLNAALALATAVGIVFSGPLVAHWGYQTIPATALAGLTASLLLAVKPWRPKSAPARRSIP